jgi:hypothetical protein
MIETKIIVKPKGNSGTGNSSGASGYGGEYVPEADYAARAGKAKKAESADLAMRANTANTADRAKYADKAGELDEEAEVLQRYIRKDIDDIVQRTVTWEKVQKLLGGLLVGEDFSFDADGNIIAHSIASENANEAEHKGFSIIQTGPKTGKYKLNINELLAFSKAKVGDKFVFDAANDFRFDAEGNIIAHSITSENANEAEHKGFSIIQTSPKTGKYKLNINELLAFSKAKVGDKFVFDAANDFRFDAEGNIIAHTIASDGANEDEEKGFMIARKDDTGKYKLCVDELLAWGSATVKQLHVKGDSTFDGNLFSKQFISDFLTGKGWGIYNKPIFNAAGVQENKWTGEFDDVIVRGSLRVYEMIISQLLGENDNRIFTGMMEVDHYDADSGKVYLNTQDGKLYNPFRRNDIIMVQQFNGMPNSSNDYYVTKNYELLVTDAGCGSLEDGDKRLDWVKFANFTSSIAGATPEALIKKKDTFVRVDNLSDPDRKGIMQIITVGTASPHMDVVYGLKTDPEGALKGRLGNLEGIVHPWFGRLQGFGEYLNNLYAVGDLILRRTGESVDTKFQVLENMFSSRFAKTSYELTNGKNYLENGQFLEQVTDADNTIIANWEMNEGEDTELWVDANGLPFMVNGSLSTSGNRKVSLEQSDGRQMLRLQNCGLRQANADIKQPGTHKEYVKGSGSINDAGLAQTEGSAVEVQDKLYVNVRIYAKSAGQLTYGFEGCKVVTGKVNELAAKTVNISYSGEWQTVGMEGRWNGTGDFIIRYSGDCYVAVVSVTDEPLSELSKTVSTQIIQTASNIKLLGENIDKVNGKTTQLGIDLDAEKGEIRQYVDTKDKKNREDTSSLITQTSSSITSSVDKKLKNQYYTITSEYSSSITQKADQITLKVSAAQTAADNAQSAADAAQGTADTAIKKNAELKVTVDGIGSKVDTKIANAKGEITKEYTSAINQSAKDITLKVSAAQTAADNAQSAADAAQGTADTAKKSVAELKVTMYGISTTVANKADTSTLNSKVSALNSSISTAKQSAIDAVNARIDGGVAEFYQQASPPSFTNLSWTKAECQRHAGALWYVVEPGAKGYATGHLYRFVVMRGTGGAWEDVDESIDSATTVQQNASGWNVASGMFDAKGNLTASGVASITPTVTTIANTRIDEKKGEIRSGLVVASDFAKLESVVAGHSSKIETFITEDDAGTLISNAKISADNIVLKGHCMKFTGGTLTITTDNFTLDEKGNVSLKGRVNATSGSIGGFNIGEYTIGSVGKTEGMGLSNECLKFMNQAYLHGEGYFITCGSYMKTGLRIFSTTSPSNNLSTGILIHIDAGTSTPSDPISGGKMCTALDLLTRWADQVGSFDMTNPYEGNHAIVIRGGDVIGLRPSFVRLAANYQTLTEYHYTVECYNTSAITIYLPSSPKYGQCYTIIQRGSRVTFSSGKGIYDVRRASSATTWYSDTRGQVSWLWYNGSQWIVCYTTN